MHGTLCICPLALALCKGAFLATVSNGILTESQGIGLTALPAWVLSSAAATNLVQLSFGANRRIQRLPEQLSLLQVGLVVGVRVLREVALVFACGGSFSARAHACARERVSLKRCYRCFPSDMLLHHTTPRHTAAAQAAVVLVVQHGGCYPRQHRLPLAPPVALSRSQPLHKRPQGSWLVWWIHLGRRVQVWHGEIAARAGSAA